MRTQAVSSSVLWNAAVIREKRIYELLQGGETNGEKNKSVGTQELWGLVGILGGDERSFQRCLCSPVQQLHFIPSPCSLSCSSQTVSFKYGGERSRLLIPRRTKSRREKQKGRLSLGLNGRSRPSLSCCQQVKEVTAKLDLLQTHKYWHSGALSTPQQQEREGKVGERGDLLWWQRHCAD